MEMSNMPNGAFQEPPAASADSGPPPAPPTTAASEAPPKRRPGRPKGSTKKGEALVPKVKRPVGRPRKDGFPAGSVGPSRPRAKQAAATTAAAAAAAGWASQPFAYAIDPTLQPTDDWAGLARTNANGFLGVLLSSLAAPNPVSSAGPSVEEAFKSHLNSLTPVSNASQPIPSLYSILKTFWLPSSPAYFSLTASASTARTPSEHRFLYWDPQPLVFNGIACPSCATPLANRGRISSGPVKIYDIEKPFFIIGCEYICRSTHCLSTFPDGRRFASTDASIFRALPAKLKDEFPARLMYADADAGCGPNIWNWGPLGVSRSLWNLVRACLRAGMGRDVILQLVEAVQRGVPEDEPVLRQGAPSGTCKPMPEGDADAQHEDAPADDAGPGAGAAGAQEGEAFVQTFIDAYTDAWKANSGSAPPAPAPPSSASASGSTAPPPSASNTTSSSTPQPQSQQQLKSPPNPGASTFDYIKSLVSYPYGTYPFFPPAVATPSISGASTTPPSVSTAGAGAAPARETATATPVPSTAGPSAPGSLKRPYPFAEDASSGVVGMSTGIVGVGVGVSVGGTTGMMDSSKRSPRHCCKCGSQDCKGKGGRSFCVNGCQDCGKLECRGRNSRRPDKKCSEGWV
ncbi:hypothetical protein H2248_008767 [Termitomyces sp. 'cryptogamus']|nr:hypothetical protein H2248_008767 [Termitomyces sp. 'cryptogamus']